MQRLTFRHRAHMYKHFSTRGVQGAPGTPNVNLGPPNISEITRARKLKLKIQLIRYGKVLH